MRNVMTVKNTRIMVMFVFAHIFCVSFFFWSADSLWTIFSSSKGWDVRPLVCIDDFTFGGIIFLDCQLDWLSSIWGALIGNDAVLIAVWLLFLFRRHWLTLAQFGNPLNIGNWEKANLKIWMNGVFNSSSVSFLPFLHWLILSTIHSHPLQCPKCEQCRQDSGSNIWMKHPADCRGRLPDKIVPSMVFPSKWHPMRIPHSNYCCDKN